jgi:hypothetical protein
MSSATLQINIVPKRMLTKSEAAQHCGRPVSRFQIECPCKPVKFSNGDLRYDVQDLDTWLNSLKADGQDHNDAEAIVARLGT